MSDSSPKRHTFPPSHRLGGREAFRRVFDQGCKASRGPLTVYAMANDVGHPRLGMTVPRRVGNAARRNRVKRMLRETYRHLRHDFPAPYDFVVVVRPHEPLGLADYQRLLSGLLVRVHANWSRREPSE